MARGSVYRAARALLDRRHALTAGWSDEFFRGRSDMLLVARRVARGSPDSEGIWHRCQVFATVVEPSEKLRTWGVGCDCHGVARQAGVSPDCPLAGRRMRQAWQRVVACEEHLRNLPQELVGAWTWLSVSPYLATVVNACTVARSRLMTKFQ